jgi:23S rRNA (cytosine1962-C5)-methyltransferase
MPKIPMSQEFLPLLHIKTKSQSLRRGGGVGLNVQSSLYSNQVEHVPEPLLSPERCAFVTTDVWPGRLAVYSKTTLSAASLLPVELVPAISSNGISSSALIEGLKLVFKRLFHRKKRLAANDTCYRLVHGGGDGMNGLVVDIYGQLIVMQSVSPQGDFVLPWAAAAAHECWPDAQIFEHSRTQSRSMAGLEPRSRELFGSCPEQVSVTFSGLSLDFAPRRAQKTGLFLDQRSNIGLLQAILPLAQPPRNDNARRVLDLCCYAGAWSAAAAKMGYGEFVLVDQDSRALDLATQNITQNFMPSTSSFPRNSDPADSLQRPSPIQKRCGDLFKELAALKEEGVAAGPQRQFDLVIADPPAFARSRKSLPEAMRAYARMVKLASRLVAPQGILVVCSCSRPVDAILFQDTVAAQLLQCQQPDQTSRTAAPGAWTWVRIGRGQQAPDHTVALGNDGSEYLKCDFYQLVQQ